MKLQDLSGQKFGNLLVEFRCPEQRWHGPDWVCLCDCGKTTIVDSASLRRGGTKSCGCQRRRKLGGDYDLTGRTIGNFYIESFNSLEEHPDKKRSNTRLWNCRCICGKVIVCSTEMIKKRVSCGCIKKPPGSKSLVGEITGTFWCSVIYGARGRNIEFLISKEEAWDLFLKQNRKCVLTGLELYFFHAKEQESFKVNQTASLDRINSDLPYTIDNVQWIHKSLQAMKMKMSDEEFINWCKLVTEHNNKKGN